MHTKRCGRKIVTLTLILTLIILVLLQQLLNTDKGWRNDLEFKTVLLVYSSGSKPVGWGHFEN